MDVQQEYQECAQRLAELKKQIKESFSFEPRQLVKDTKGIFYRFDHVYLPDSGVAEIVVREIRNNRVNWQSCSTPRFKSKEELEVVDWSFDSDREQELYDIINNSDSIRETKEAKEELKELYLSCHHNWEKNGDEYHCTECHRETETETENGWLNGETENSNIALDIA